MEQVGSPEEVFHRPATPFVARFLGSANLIEGLVKDGKIITELGELSLKDDIQEDSIVMVLLRPDDVEMQEYENGGESVIVGRVFQGMHYLYTVKLPSGRRIRCLQHHVKNYRLNTRVKVKISDHYEVVYFKHYV